MKQKAANNSYHHIRNIWLLHVKLFFTLFTILFFNKFKAGVINKKSNTHDLQHIKENATEEIFNNKMLKTCLVNFLYHANKC
jgi:hypothetical protein